MIRNIFAAALVAAVPATAISAQDVSEDKLPVTVVFDQTLPNVPGKSMRGVLVEYEPGGSSPAHTHPRSAFIYATVLEGAIKKPGQRWDRDDISCRRELVRASRGSSSRQRECQLDEASAPARGVRPRHRRNGAGHSLRGMNLAAPGSCSGAVREPWGSMRHSMHRIADRMLAGVSVPDTPLVERAMEYARQKCEPYLFNHVVRSWLFAARIGQLQSVVHDAEVVAVGALLHDITLNERFAGPRRFEVEGADLARGFAREAGFDERRAQLIWDSVALNSTPSIGLYKEAEVALCTAGVCLDVVGLQYEPHSICRDSKDRRRVPAPRHETADDPVLLPHRRDKTGNHLRQLRPGFRRALRARLQGAVGSRLRHEHSLPGMSLQAKPMQIDHLHSMTSPRLRVIGTDAKLQAAALALSKPDIGLVIVCHDNGAAVGVLSKSDLVRHLARSGSAGATAATLMSRRVVSCRPDDDVHAVWQAMTAQALQNVPVLGADSKPLGVLDIRDAMKVLFEHEEFEERLLANYIAGIGYQ